MGDDGEPEGGEVVRVDFGGPRAPAEDAAGREAVAGPELSAEDQAANRAKLEAFTAMIDRGMTMVTLDARRDDVAVPEELRGEVQLGLNFSHKFFLDDFTYDERGVRASLSFSGTPFFCDVPWTAVWMMRSHIDGELVLVPESVPDELKAALAQAAAELDAATEGAEQAAAEGPEQAATEGAEQDAPGEGGGGDGDADDGDPEAAGEGDADGGGDGSDEPPTKGGLRLVKS